VKRAWWSPASLNCFASSSSFILRPQHRPNLHSSQQTCQSTAA